MGWGTHYRESQSGGVPRTLWPPDEREESLGGSHSSPQVHFSYLHVGVHAGEFNFPKRGDPSIVNQPPEPYKTKQSTIYCTNRLLNHITELCIMTCDGEDQKRVQSKLQSPEQILPPWRSAPNTAATKYCGWGFSGSSEPVENFSLV